MTHRPFIAGTLFLLGACLSPAETKLRVPLRFERGSVAVEASRSTLSESASPAARADQSRMLTFINERLKALGPVCRWNTDINALHWNVRGVETMTETWPSGTARLRAWLQRVGGDDYKESSWTDQVLEPGLRSTYVSAPFFNVEKTTPLTFLRDETNVQDDEAVLVFAVADPITAGEIARAVRADPPYDRLVPDITRSLRALEGRLWWSADVKAIAEDFLRLISIEPAQAWGPLALYFPLELADATARTVTFFGPSPLTTLKLKSTAASEDERQRQLLLATYNLLPTDSFRDFRQKSPHKLVKDVEFGAVDAYLIDLSETGLQAEGFRPVRLQLADAANSEGRLTALGYEQNITGTSRDPATGTAGKVTVIFSAPDPAEGPDATPTKKKAPAVKTAAEKRNLLEISAGQHKGAKYFGTLRYQRKRLGGDNTLALGAETEESTAGADFNYDFDYVGFVELGRRLSIAITGGREPASDRQAGDKPATEKKDSLEIRSTLEVWRNLPGSGDGASGQWLNIGLELGAERSQLTNKEAAPAPVPLDYDIAQAVLKLTYSRNGFAGGLPWTDAVLEFGAASDTGGGSNDYRWSKLSLAHRRLAFASVRWEGRADLHWAGGNVPLAAAPSFGGEDSVRSFARDSARGRAVWAFKNELWFRPPANLGLPEGIGTVLHRATALAIFGDIGGVLHPRDHAVRQATAAGLGIRVLQGPVTIRADWAHSVAVSGRLPSANAGYLTINYRPIF